MYTIDVRLPDGRLIGPPDLQMFGPALTLCIQRRRSIAVAAERLASTKGNAVVLVKNSRVLGEVYGCEDWSAAFTAAGKQLVALYARKNWPRPMQGIVAGVRPFPKVYLGGLARFGVDTVYSPEHLHGADSFLERISIDHWIGRVAYDSTRQQRRTFLMDPYQAKP